MKKIIYLGLFLLLSVSLSAQIVANGNSGSAVTAYTNGAPNDPIYIWCSEGLGTTAGSLTATSPSGAGPFTFKWFYHNQTNSSWAPLTTQTGTSSTISNLASDGYRVQVYSAANTLIACYNAWVWNMNAQMTAASQPSGCDTSNLLGSLQINGSFTYYNPPPPEAIITPLTQISVTFNATHTYVSDLAFYLVAPNGVTIALMPNPGVTGNPGGGICNSSDNVINFTLNNTSTNYIDVCTPDVPLSGTWGGYMAGSPLVPTPINWAPLYGINAAQGGWAVQIYDCIGADVGALTNATITFNNLDATCNATSSITYASGNINSVINDNSCSAASASIFSVPVSPALSTPITVNASSNFIWTATAGGIANPASLNTTAGGLPVGTTIFTLTANVSYQSTVCTYTKSASFTRDPIILGEPNDLIVCAVGQPPYTFDLTENNDEILNGLDPVVNEVTFYHTAFDADNGFNAILASDATSYETDGTEEEIWVRVTNYFSDCHEITSFIIRADPAPEANSPADQQMCDNDNNGSEIFDLTSLDGDALAGQDPNEFVVSYHTTLSGATDNTALVTNPTAVPVTNGQTVYIRVTNVDSEDCYATSSVNFIVTPKPVVVVPADAYACSDEGYTLPPLTVGNYFTGTNGTGTQLAPGTVLTTSQTVYVYAQSNTTPNNCTDQGSFTVTINPLPVVDEPVWVEACESFFLDPLSTPGQHYYTGQGGTGTQYNEGDEITDNITLYIYEQTGSAATVLCSDEYEFRVKIDKRPVLVPATEIKECDDNFDGVAVFNLTPAGTEVVNGASGVVVSYHTSAFNAQYNLEPIQQPDTYQASTSTVYIRAIKATSTTDCYAVEPLQLTVLPKPAVSPISDYVLCDDNNSPDGVEFFDLTTKAAEVTNNPDVTITYYPTQLDAINETAEITDAANYQSGTATVWVRLESSLGCFNTTSFELVVNPLPVVDTNMEPLYACEEQPGEGLFDLSQIETLVTMGASGYSVAYYATLNDAQNPTPDNYLPSTYLSPNTTIYVRVENVITECVVITTASLEVLPAPIAPNVAPLEECDFNNDDVTAFNMDPVLQGIMDAMGGAVTLTVHETIEDAQFGTNAIQNTSNYTNVFALTTSGVQTVYIVVKSAFTDCFDIVPLQLIVHPVPEAVEPEPYVLCDNGTNDTDGIAIFDLTTKEAEILGPMDPAQFSIAFYTNAASAANGTGVDRINTPASWPSATASVWARVSNNATGCYDVMELELIVNPLPVANNPVPYTLCDNDTPGNEIEVFDLTTKIDEIITVAGVPQQGINTSFYHTYDDAVAGINAISNPEAYTNNGAVETIFVKVELEATGCYRIVLLDVRVEPLPVLVPPTAEELTVCDTTGLGIGEFDLNALVVDMVNGAPNLQVTFHHTQQDAINNVNAIPNTTNYHNVNPFVEMLYVRVENLVTGCTSNTPYVITLTVSPAPIAPEDLEDLVLCDDQDNNGQDGRAYFDLTQQDTIIHTAMGTNPSTLTIHYFTSEANAQNGAPRITNASNYYGTNGQTIWVRVETPGTECFSITSFDLELNEPLLLTTPTMLVLCNEDLPNDGITLFDLTVKNDEILGIYGIGQGNTITYFEQNPRTVTGATPISNPEAYQNSEPGVPPLINPRTLYVMVTTPEGCKSYTTLTIKVLPLPQPDLNPDPLVLCDVNGSPDGEEIFDLTDAESDIRDNDFNMVLTYYETEEDANNRTNQITNITAYNSGNATIWVRAEANTQDSTNPVCFRVVSFELIVNPLPALGVAGVIAPYAICEQNTDGIATFDFNTHMDEILGAGADPADYTVTFYRDAAAQGLGTAMPYIYTNTSSPNVQNILVEVKRNDTECTITAPLTLLVEEAAIANPVTETFFECDYDGTNDGVFTFDLTRADDDALGTQNPANYSVTYYTTPEDAEAGTNAIANPTAYQNTPDYQMIWVRVTNESTVSGCHEVTTLELFVERIPEPSLAGGTICVNFDTQEVLRPHPMDSGLDATHTFVWYHDGVVIPDATGPTYTATAAGEYTVVATSATGCVSDPIAPVTVLRSGPASPIGIGYVVSNAFSDEQIITVLAQGYGEYQYQLDNGPWQNSNVFTNVYAGPHEIHVRDISTDDPCDEFNMLLEDVSVIDYPNFFTPNGDGYHDYWNIIGMKNFDNVQIYIFDRYGKLMKQISPAGLGWDGTFNGYPVLADDYWFTVTYTEGDVTKEFKAHFALKR
ncbi:T9SS type B sorting domain-containing protein [Flavobacterium sp. DGU11]|uniref:T9SS type B sorting domain-containing protein n=1 Tax=Flavobacterium arundinis TaxID=3139143 RepID=A0ABU9HSY3_9FLAO